MDINFFKTTRILDGGMGQELLARGMKANGTLWSANAVLKEEYHQLLLDTHLDFTKAGAEVIVTATFTTRRIRLRDNKIEDKFEYLNKKAGEIAQKAKEQYIENFEKELGPFADKVKERSARLLENQNFRASQGSIRSKYTNALQPDGSVNLFGKGMNVFPSGKLLFEDISKNLSDLVGKGQITPEQAAQIQREIYLNDLKVSPTEYANILKNNKTVFKK